MAFITDADAAKIEIEENNEPLVHIHEFAPYVALADDEYLIPYVRKSFAKKLERVSIHVHTECDKIPTLRDLSSHLELYIFDAFRSPVQQAAYHKHFMNEAQLAYPEKSETELRQIVDEYVAPVGEAKRPAHLSGGAIDVRLRLNYMGQRYLIDLTQAEDELVRENVSHCYDGNRAFAPMDVEGLNETIQKLRGVLKRAFAAEDIVGLDNEYWHFSHGDQYAAAKLNRRTATFDNVAAHLVPCEIAVTPQAAAKIAQTRFPNFFQS